MKTFFLTTPIYYPNARPHVGSAYTTIVCDVIARYKRMCGYDVAFLTGTDEHGEKLARAAAEAGKSPPDFVAEKRELFKTLWRTLGIDDYRFVHTSQNPPHEASVQWMIREADKAGYIDKKKYEGRYCVFDERYVSDSTEPADCDICGRPAELISEENYFFKLSRFGGEDGPLMKLYQDNPGFVQPEYRMNEVKSFVKGGLRDISISRKRLKWGIPWPGDKEQVVYVWYDALTSYLTGIGFQGEKRSRDFERFWMGENATGLGPGNTYEEMDSRLRGNDSEAKRGNDSEAERTNHTVGHPRESGGPVREPLFMPEAPREVVHMIGKDILRFHAVYWPAFLMAAGLPLPTTVFAHGWIYYEQDKMSKSKGNVVYPEPIVQGEGLVPGRRKGASDRQYEELLAAAKLVGNDALRYYLLRETTFGQDTSFSYDKLIERYNSDLANDLGNLASRTLNMLHQNFGGVLPNTPEPLGAGSLPQHQFRVLGNSTIQKWIRCFDNYDFSGGLDAAWQMISVTNRYLGYTQPWTLAGDISKRDRLASILRTSAEALRLAAVFLHPVLPVAAQRLWAQLGRTDEIRKVQTWRLAWDVPGDPTSLRPGTRIGKPEPIFPRLDKAKTLAKLHELAEADYRGTGVSPVQEDTARMAVPQPKGAHKVTSGEWQVASEKPEESAIGNQQSTMPTPQPAGSETRTPNPESQQAAPTTPQISIDDFAKVEMRVGEIIAAEPIPKATKLLKIQVDIGTEVRQVLAGIAEHYKPEDLIGMKVVVVTNLQPRKMRGLESNGMIVAASVGEGGKPVLVTFREEVPNGAKLR